ncbi:MAG TPA: class I SAM-dependent methyltransferase [Candidatus Limnocylindria bacterium]|nr:class I SAM-dependent methyltransferase [Candidatus Limnocylindria bacterium]
MRHAGDVARARASLETRRGANLRYVLRKRFSWMRPYLGEGRHAVELGCGAGFSRMFLDAPLELTDVEPQPWVDRVVDALAMPYSDASVDVLIANNVIHHLATPPRFFAEAARVLRAGGHLLVQECACSLATRLAIRVTGHEAYSFDADPFDPAAVCNDPADPWSANCAIPDLLFDDHGRFERAFAAFEVVDDGKSEFLLHFNSGGVTASAPYVPLPQPLMRVADAVDAALVALLPGVFAAQRRVVLRRRP